MAALLLGCCSVFSSRISDKRRARREREMEYSENFETLKEENAKRVRHLSDAGAHGYDNYLGSGYGDANQTTTTTTNTTANRSGNINATTISTTGSREPSIESGSSQCGGQSPQQMDTVQQSQTSTGLLRGLPSYEDVVR